MAYSVPLAGVALPWSDDGGELIYLAGKTVRQKSEEVWDSRKMLLWAGLLVVTKA